jgi:hypothetical protein
VLKPGISAFVPLLALLAFLQFSQGTCAADDTVLPDPDYCYADWLGLYCDSTRASVFTCPEEDGSRILVNIRDEHANPISGAAVSFDIEATCDYCECNNTSILTDSMGYAHIDLDIGLDVRPSEECCVVTTTVTCRGVVIPWLDGSPSDTRNWLSPDLNGDCVVNSVDENLFLNDFPSAPGPCRTDYDCSDAVDVLDYAVLMSHMDHECIILLDAETEVQSVHRPHMLEQNYPNPFNPLTRIAFTAPRPGRATLRVFDLSGRLVRTLLDEQVEPRIHVHTWDGRDDYGSPVSSGVYFCTLELAGEVQTKKMLLVK